MLKDSLFNVDDGTEITSLDEYVRRIKDLTKQAKENNAKLFYRGQKAHFWSITPSIFRKICLV